MSEAGALFEQQQRILMRVASLGLELAENLQARALAAKEDAVAADLARAFQRTAQVIRHAVALQARLHIDGQRQDREAGEDAARRDEAARERRRSQVRAAVAGAVRLQPGLPAAPVLAALDAHLKGESLAERFLDEPAAAQIARLCRRLGVAPPAEVAQAEAPGAQAPAKAAEAPGAQAPAKAPVASTAHPRESGDPGFSASRPPAGVAAAQAQPP